jgi:phosphatidylinositol glycan class O
MSNDTILFVIGDHGMTSDGNHGGATYNETITTTFCYSKRRFHPALRKYKIAEYD